MVWCHGLKYNRKKMSPIVKEAQLFTPSSFLNSYTYNIMIEFINNFRHGVHPYDLTEVNQN